MFSIVFLSLCSLSFARKTNKWADLGCTSEGVLSPANAPDLWPSRATDIYQFVQLESSLAVSACKGPQTHSSMPSTFHLLWECYDDSEICTLPTLNVQGLKTLVAFHPESTVNVWSNTLGDLDFGENVEVKRYDESLFKQLPENAHRAYETIPTFFDTVVESHSHFSDLFRLAVLYKYGGIWTDFDSLWVDSVDSVSTEDAWIPLSSGKLSGWDLINGNSFIEGGMMQFPAGNSFIERALHTFPEYTQDVAACWACVGPKHLTNTYISMKAEGAELPATVPSAKLFGGSNYRRNLPKMHHSLDLEVVRPKSVAFHLFTSSGEFDIKQNSLIDFLFRAAGVDVHAKGLKHMALGKLSQRRRLQDAEGSDVYTPETKAIRVVGEYEQVVGDDKEGFLEECSLKYAPTRCVGVDVYAGSVVIEFMGEEEDLDNIEVEITDNGFQLDSMDEALPFVEVVETEPEEPTETPEEYVSRTDFDDLLARVDRLEILHADVQANIDEVDAGLTTVATCVANYQSPASDDSTDDDSTSDVEGYVLIREGTKCVYDSAVRSFKLAFTTEENCAARCEADDGCQYFSTNEHEEEQWCIGCNTEPTADGEGWLTFQLATRGRRRLNRQSEIEQLRADNEALRTMLRAL